MGARGPAPKPALQIVREGNPGHHSQGRLEGGLVLPPERPDEPDWSEWFPYGGSPAQRGVNARCRRIARLEWRLVVRVLHAQGLLTALDETILRNYCITVARIDQCERDISVNGLKQLGERGWMKNGATTVLSQLQGLYKWYVGQLGLSPVARDQMPKAKPGTDDDPFD